MGVWGLVVLHGYWMELSVLDCPFVSDVCPLIINCTYLQVRLKFMSDDLTSELDWLCRSTRIHSVMGRPMVHSIPSCPRYVDPLERTLERTLEMTSNLAGIYHLKAVYRATVLHESLTVQAYEVAWLLILGAVDVNKLHGSNVRVAERNYNTKRKGSSRNWRSQG
jgi:hypothetical protein